MGRNKIDRTGKTNTNKEGCIMKIVEYNSKFIKKILDSFTQWLSNKFRGWIGYQPPKF